MTELDRTLRDSASARPLPTMVPTYEGRPLAHPEEPIFDQGLAFDLETELSRRKVLKLIGYGGLGAGLLTLAACGPSASSSSPGASASAARCGHLRCGNRRGLLGRHRRPTPGASVAPSAAGGGSTDCDVIPEETAGPFPGDGSNGPDVLVDERRRPQGHHGRASASPRARPRACRSRSG